MNKENVTPKKFKLLLGIVIAIAFAVIVTSIVWGIAQTGNSQRKMEELLRLGERYRFDQDYEQAVTAYLAAIEIDPMNAAAYVVLAEAYVGMDEYASAVNALTDGYDMTKDEGIMEAMGDVYLRWADFMLKKYDVGIGDEAASEEGVNNEKELVRALEILEEGYAITEDELLAEYIAKLTQLPTEEYVVNSNQRDARSGAGEQCEEDQGNGLAWTDRMDILPYEEGGYIVFGAYEQDDDLTNGPEPIEWQVLGSDDNGSLLISRFVLDAQPYNVEKTDITWEDCTLHQWLNNDFVNSAFTEAEQEYLNTVTITNPDNYVWQTPGGDSTIDRVFLLDVDEIINYYGLASLPGWNAEVQYGYSRELQIKPTEYALNTRKVWHWTISQEEYYFWLAEESGYSSDAIGTGGASWWMRSPGHYSDDACIVNYFGLAGWINYDNVNDLEVGVRPSVYLKW